jgi:ribonuclease J
VDDNRQPTTDNRTMRSGTLRIVPLGGLGEIGMNLMVVEYGDAAIALDCGMMFPDAATLGVDVIVPDMTYLFENAARLKAVFLTHAHEDHIGALPFLVERVPVPVYGMPLTLGFLRDKLEEFAIGPIELRVLKPRDIVETGPFRLEAIRVTHSIVDALGFAIRTPAGTVIHTGDFKIDHTPIDGLSTDLARLARYGEEGVLLLMSDSTNALVPGHGPSERSVGSGLERAFSNASGRIIITTFASHIHRIQQVIDLARKYRRKVAMVGRSLIDNAETAERLGYLRIPRDLRVNGSEGDPRSLVILTTGTQGEPSSALSRMAVGEHKQVEITRGDTVIISARTIPGNERAVVHMVDNLYRRGAEVITWDTADVARLRTCVRGGTEADAEYDPAEVLHTHTRHAAAPHSPRAARRTDRRAARSGHHQRSGCGNRRRGDPRASRPRTTR